MAYLVNDANRAFDSVEIDDEIPTDQLPTDTLAAAAATTGEIPGNSDAGSAYLSSDPIQHVTAPLVLPDSLNRAANQMAIRGHIAVEYLRAIGSPLVDHYVLDILDREAAKPHPSLWYRRYADLLLVAQDRLGELLPVQGRYLDDQTRRYLGREILFLADSTASIVVSYLDVSAEQHIKSAYKGWFAAESPITEELSLEELEERRSTRQARLELFRAELDSIKMRLYESFLVNITLPLGQLVAGLDKCTTDLQHDFYLGMIAYGGQISLASMASSSAELFPHEQIGEFEFDFVLRDREVNESSTRRRVAVTLIDGTSDEAESLQALEARDRERALARYGWTGLAFTEGELAADLRGCVEKVLVTYLGPLPPTEPRASRRGHSYRFST